MTSKWIALLLLVPFGCAPAATPSAPVATVRDTPRAEPPVLVESAPLDASPAVADVDVSPAAPKPASNPPCVQVDQDPYEDPPGIVFFPTTACDDGVSRMDCGDYVVVTTESKEKSATRLEIIRRGTTERVLDTDLAENNAYGVRWCFDLDGDGQPELDFFHKGNGAHCCTDEAVITLGRGVKKRLLIRGGNGEGAELVPRNLDNKGAYELVGNDDGWAYLLAGVGFGANPLGNIVFVLEGGKYVQRTARFPKYLEQLRDEQFDRIRSDGYDPAFGNDIAGLSILLGDWVTQRKKLQVDSEELQRLDKMLPTLRRHLGRPHHLAF